jgi:GTPase
LVNTIMGQKVAITTSVPQTTRHAFRVILHTDDAQIVFVDTPGLHKPKTLLGSRLNDLARDHLGTVDVLVFMVDGERGIGRGDRYVAGLLAEGTPVIAVLNKIDRIGPSQILPQLEELQSMGGFEEIVPVSAATGAGVDTLVELIIDRLPEGPPYFPDGQVTDQTLEQRVAEIIREKAITLMREEVPHSIAVAVEEVESRDSRLDHEDAEDPAGVTRVHATVYVERESQKGIVIGKGGQMLRTIGQRARKELELVLGSRVYLDLRVKLMKEWQRDPRALERLGY